MQITSWIATISDLLNLGAFAKITKSINQSFEEASTHLSSNYKIPSFSRNLYAMYTLQTLHPSYYYSKPSSVKKIEIKSKPICRYPLLFRKRTILPSSSECTWKMTITVLLLNTRKQLLMNTINRTLVEWSSAGKGYYKKNTWQNCFHLV